MIINQMNVDTVGLSFLCFYVPFGGGIHSQVLRKLAFPSIECQALIFLSKSTNVSTKTSSWRHNVQWLGLRTPDPRVAGLRSSSVITVL